jgi:hypothetical protein
MLCPSVKGARGVRREAVGNDECLVRMLDLSMHCIKSDADLRCGSWTSIPPVLTHLQARGVDSLRLSALANGDRAEP